MTTAIQFALLGLGIGTAYTLLAQGMLLIYRGSGVINFAHGAVAMLAAYIYWQLRVDWGVPTALAMVATVGVCGLLGWGTYQVIMRPLGRASALARVISTLGIFMLLQGVALLIWGAFPKTLDSDLPTTLVTVAGVSVGLDKILLLVIALVLTTVLWLAGRRSALGLAIRANAENQRATATLGWSPHLLGGLTWGVGWAVAGIAGILIAPLVGVTVDAMPLLVIPVLAAALIGRLSSFWWTFGGAMIIGVLQSLVSRYVDFVPGAMQAVPFLVILLLLVVRGQGVPARSTGKQTLPTLGTGRISWPWVVGVTAVGILLFLLVFPESLVVALGVTASWGMVLLSVVLLLGYTGQLSLAQVALGGVAALVAGRLVVDAGFPFPVAVLAGLAAVLVVGGLFALPALRTRGIDLAIVTLGLGSCVSALVFANGSLTGGYDGTPVGPQSLFGLDLDTILYPRRWAVFVLVMLVLCAIVVANIRRGSSGRRMIAVRTNERAASALGVDVVRVKLYAFCVAAVVAGVGGITLAFRNPTILYSEFDPIQSVLAVGYSFIGGVGYIAGAPTGGTLVNGGFGSWVIHSIFPDASPAWLMSIAGLSVLLFALMNPDGMIRTNLHLIDSVKARFRRHRPARTAKEQLPPATPHTVPPATLAVESVVVRFGGVTAVAGADLTVSPGEIVGLIGPNGAGKTTLIDTVTGFVPPAEGSVSLNGESMNGWPVHRRTRAGVSRSFQSLELFESSTVRENLGVASDPSAAASYVKDLVAPSRSPLSPAAVAAVCELDLVDSLDTVVSDLSYGRRRLVAIARAIATQPSVLLLDEPAAGLSSGETLELARVVRRLADAWGLGVLVIEHDMAFVMGLCDKVVVLNFGRQIASGTPDEVRADPEVIRAYLGEQSTARPAGGSAGPVPVTAGQEA
ncbi:ATP-binding cassette domain-containing protein [Nakamurella sp. YIM 132087]|uniref:ATP-binding cassette domain-containing protein n=1 Tax=Nakamurella alba TaxID=2665158 RepID=A0A7K1FSL5_9ACTN|nr:branched-chain amino acid ABC transporter permease/ATP-binding protein [Nakamurella alba]MTD17108.1 ATP-binding cassette domain-containing protein [Nakamurella alba]